MLSQKSGYRILKMAVLFLRAVGTDMNGLGVVHTEHSHKAFGVHQSLTVANQHPKGLNRGNFHEFLHISERLQDNIKLLQGFYPPMLYKQRFIMYNVQTLYQLFSDFQYDALDEPYNAITDFLVELT